MSLKNKVKRISISLPPDLLYAFDELTKSIGYERSRAVQIAMRNFIASYYWVRGQKSIIGALLVIYDHEIRGIVDRIIDVQHKYSDLITSSMHVHLDERKCLEIIIVKGVTSSVKKLFEEITSIDGIINIATNIVAA